MAGGKLYSFRAGTSTPLATYTDITGGTANANPTILDSAGEAQVWLGNTYAYKLDLYSALDVQQPGFPVDHLGGSLAGGLTVASAIVPAVNGAAVLTAAALIPAGARVLTVSTKILVAFGTSGGLTGFSVGDGGISDRWGQSAALTLNALTGCSDAPAAAQQHDSSLPLYPTATSVVLSAIGGLFDATGSLEVSCQYLLTPHRSA